MEHLCASVEVPEGEVRQVDLGDGRVLAVYRVDGEVFATGAGFVDLAEFGEKLRVRSGVFVAEDGVALDGEPVLEGVLRGGGFAFGGTGAGAVLGVGAVLRNKAVTGFRLPTPGFRR